MRDALTWVIVNLVWKRRKDLLYLGSLHGGDLSEMYGTGDRLGTDAIGRCILIPLISATDHDSTSKLHQPPRPQPSEGFHSPKSIVKDYLAQVHGRE